MQSFRSIAHLSIPKAKNSYINSLKDVFERTRPGGDMEDLFIWDERTKDKDKAFEQLKNNIGDKAIKDSLQSVDAISLLLTHTILENFFYNLLNVCQTSNPQFFCLTIKPKKNIEIIDLAEANTKQVFNRVSEIILNNIEKKTLIDKADYLYKICSSVAQRETMKGFTYGRDFLIEFDEKRHKIVHGLKFDEIYDDMDNKLFYLQKIGMHFFVLVNRKFNARLISDNRIYTDHNFEPLNII
jgi:hypothetical protein